MNPAETLELADQIKSLDQHGLTILLIEHKLDVVASSPTRSSCSTTARRLPKATPDAVRRDEEVIRAYLGRSAVFA